MEEALMPIITKFDATRDLKGTFFVADGDFNGIQQRLKTLLEEDFSI